VSLGSWISSPKTIDGPTRAFSVAALAGVSAFLVTWALLSWSVSGGQRVLVVNATFSSKACCRMQIWLNAAQSREDSIDLPMQQGMAVNYEFPMSKTLITRVRLKLGDVPGSWVTINRIYVRHGSQVVSEVPRQQLTQFVGYFAVKDEAHGPSAYRVDERAAMLDNSKLSLNSGAGSFQLALARVVGKADGFYAGLVVAGMLGVALVGVSRRRLLLLPSLVAVVIAIYFVPDMLGGLPLKNDVTRAVSYCAFIGVSKPRERLMIIAAALIAFAVPSLVGWLSRRDRSDDPQEAVPRARTHDMWSSRQAATLATTVPLTLILLLLVPDLRAQLSAAKAQTWTTNWDSNNFLAWDYLVDHGLVPMKNFFYLYGLQYLFTINLPWGSVIRFFTMGLFWTYIVLGTWAFLSGFFSSRTLVVRHLVVMSFVVSFALAGFDLGARYSAPLGPVLLFCSFRLTDPVLNWRRIVFCVALAQLTLFEFAQAVYALGPIVFLIVVELLIRLPERPRPAVGRWLVTTASTIAVPIATAAVVLAVTGQLWGVAFFYGQLNALTSTYAYPAPVTFWFTHPHNISSFVLWAYPVTLALGSYGLLAFRGARRDLHARIIAIGLIGFMIMQRQVIRDGAETGMWVSSIYGLLIWGVAEASRVRVRHAAAVASVFGAVAALALTSGAYGRGWLTLKSGPKRVANDIGSLLHDAPAYDAAAASRWETWRFAGYPELPVVRALQREPPIKAGGRFWVLGDAAPFTFLTHTVWPYYFTEFYDGSPIAYQRKVLAQLADMPPTRVVFDFRPYESTFDAVPNAVRVPLLFDWSVKHLVPTRLVGDWAVMRPRRPNEPIALSWWRRRLGRTLDLGLLPEDISVGHDLCVGGPSCRTYIVVTPTAGASLPSSFVVPIEVDGLEFDVQLETDPSVHRYVIDLSRAWFWSAAPPGVSRTVDTNATPGATVEVTKRLRDPGVLY
jgi:hypothetical protein